MNLKDLPEGLPAKIIHGGGAAPYIGWIVRKINIESSDYTGIALEKIDDPKKSWKGNYCVIEDLFQIELDYNTPFSIRYLPENDNYIAEIVGVSSDHSAIKEHIGKKVKIINSSKHCTTILVDVSVNNPIDTGHYWVNLQQLKDEDIFQLKLVTPIIEDNLIEPHELKDGESAIIVQWGDNPGVIGKTWFRKGDKFGIEELNESTGYWLLENIKSWKNCKVKRILKNDNIMPEQTIGTHTLPKKKIKFDTSGFFSQFVKATLEVKQQNNQLFELIIKKVCEGTNHNNLIEFNNDLNIDILTKINIYTAAMCAIEDSKKSGILKFENPAVIKSVDTSADAIRKEYDTLAGRFNSLNEQNTKLLNNLDAREKLLEITKQEIESLKKNAPQILQIVDKILDHAGQPFDEKLKVSIGPEERFHKQLPDILKILKIRNARGFTEFIWLWGAPGSGKTHLGEQIAKSISLTYYPFPADPTVTAGKLLGFNNIATGSFIQGWLYKPYKEGGLAFIDEGDLMDASCFAGANSIENAYFTFGNGERVERHKDFYLIVSANTKGTGATKGFQRNKLDAATLNRFTMIELEYDEDLEKKIYGNEHWAEYVHKVRAYCNNTFKETVHITSRPIRKGAAYLTDKTISREYICDITLFCLMSKDQKQQVLNNVGIFHDIPVIDINQDASMYFDELKQSIKNQFRLPDDKLQAVKYLREQINKRMGIMSGLVYPVKALGDLNGFIQACKAIGEFPKEYHNTPIDK